MCTLQNKYIKMKLSFKYITAIHKICIINLKVIFVRLHDHYKVI